MRPATSRRALLVLAAVVAAVLVLIPLTAGGDRNPADASDAETAALIGHFNQYRASQGVGSLSTSATLNANAQAAAEESVTKCGYYLPDGPGHKWAAYGYETAETLWAAYANDAQVSGWIADPKYHSVGVGRARDDNCPFGWLWMMILDTSGSGGPPPPTQTGSQIPTQSPAGATTATAPPTSTPTATPSPSPSPFVRIRGDINCDGVVNLADAIELLKAVGGATAIAACLTFDGLDCTGGINEADVLTLLLYLGGIAGELPSGCPLIGATMTATPEPTATGATPTGTATLAPSATATPTAPPDAAMDHCWLALIAYDMTYAWTLDGEVGCAPVNGASYACMFHFGNQVDCVSAAAADYACYVYGDGDVPCTGSGGPDYSCSRGDVITCTAQGGPAYACSVEGQEVACTGPATFIWSPA